MKIGGGLSVEVEEKNEIFIWGDELCFGIMMVEGMLSGNLFVG